jgi:hypothetical protein
MPAKYLTMKIRVRVSFLTGSGQARRRRRRSRDFTTPTEGGKALLLAGYTHPGGQRPRIVFFITGFSFVSCPGMCVRKNPMNFFSRIHTNSEKCFIPVELAS